MSNKYEIINNSLSRYIEVTGVQCGVNRGQLRWKDRYRYGCYIYIFFYNLSCCNKLDLIYKNKVAYASIHVYQKANKNLHLEPFGILRITLDKKV